MVSPIVIPRTGELNGIQISFSSEEVRILFVSENAAERARYKGDDLGCPDSQFGLDLWERTGITGLIYGAYVIAKLPYNGPDTSHR